MLGADSQPLAQCVSAAMSVRPDWNVSDVPVGATGFCLLLVFFLLAGPILSTNLTPCRGSANLLAGPAFL